MVQFVVWAIAGLNLPSASSSTNPPPEIHIAIAGPPGHQTPELSWDAQVGAVYLVQSRTSLDADVPWETVEPVRASETVARWKAPELNSQSDTRFYQVIAPQPEIFEVQPTVVDPGGGTIYVVGQCLAATGMARVGGLVLPPNVLQPGSVYSITLPH